jgi:hypothetical protein
VAEFEQLALNFLVSSAGILPGHAGATEGFVVTQFLTVRSIARSRAFYSRFSAGRSSCLKILASSGWRIHG